MIGMMYLVLTAMLALNVSTDILNGFTVVDNSLHASIEGNKSRNDILKYRFESANKREPLKIGPWYTKAEDLHKRADELYDFIQNFKEQIFIIADGQAAFDKLQAEHPGVDVTNYLTAKDKTDPAGQYALAQGHGAELRTMLEQYRDHLCNLVDSGEYGDQMREELRTVYQLDEVYSENDKKMIPWAEAQFEGMPSAAAIALLSKIQNDVRATEGQMVQYLYDRTTAGDIVVNRMEAYAIAQSNRVRVGDQYQAQLLLAGIDTIQTPEYYVNGQKIAANGMYTFTASGVGEHAYNVEIHYRNNAGEPVVARRAVRYFVEEALGQDKKPEVKKEEPKVEKPKEVVITKENQKQLAASVSVSNTDVAVLYANYTHTFRVTSSQIDASQLTMTASAATVSPAGNGYFKVRATGAINTTCQIAVYGNYQGKQTKLEEQTLKIKKLPDAKIRLMCGGSKLKSGAEVPKAKLTSGASLEATMPSYVVINAPYSIQKYELRVGTRSCGTSDGASLSAAQIDAIKKYGESGVPVKFVNIQTNNGVQDDDFVITIK